ncbi:MAG: hypothetical protein ACI4DY_08110 [Monoglobaceae bacterium]
MKRKNRFIMCFAAMVCIICLSVTAGAVEPSSNRNWLDNSPRENIFKVDGSSQEFVLLETTDSNTSKFFIFAKDFYGNMAFDTGGSTVFDVRNPNNVGFWLNNGFLQFGFGGKNGKIFKLPDSIIEHIDRNHEWKIEAGLYVGARSDRYGVSLLSQEELLKHKDKIGVRDTINDADTFTVSGWMLRDVYLSALSYRYGGPFEGRGDIWSWGVKDLGMAVRPVFYLDKDFFKEVKLDVNDIGVNVISMFKKMYSMDELRNIYTDEELWDIFGYKAGIMLDVTGFTDENGERIENLTERDYVYVMTDIKSAMVDSCDVMVMSILYGSDNCPITFARKRLRLNSGEEKTADIGMALKDKYKEKGAYIKTYVLECGSRLNVLSNAVRIPLAPENADAETEK